MSLRLFDQSNDEKLSHRQKILYKQAKDVFSYTRKVFKFTSDMNNTEEAMKIVAHMVDNLAAFIRRNDFLNWSIAVTKEISPQKYISTAKFLFNSELITLPLLGDFAILPEGYQRFFRDIFFVKEFVAFQDLETDVKHQFSEENFRGAIAYYCFEGERQKRLEKLSSETKRRREIKVNLFNRTYDSYENTPIEEAQFNTAQTKKLFIDCIIDPVRDAHMKGYGNPHGNCTLMTHSAFLEAAYRIDERVTFIQIYMQNNPSKKTESALAIGDFPNGEFYMVSPWLTTEEESISHSTQFRADMNSREDRTYSIVIKVGKPSEDNFRKEIRTALKRKQYESWMKLPKRNSNLQEVERTARLFFHNLSLAHEDFISATPPLPSSSPPPIPGSPPPIPNSSPPIPDSSSPPPLPPSPGV